MLVFAYTVILMLHLNNNQEKSEGNTLNEGSDVWMISSSDRSLNVLYVSHPSVAPFTRASGMAIL